MSLLRLGFGMILAGIPTAVLAWNLPGINGATLLAAVLIVGGIVCALVHEYRTAPYGEDVSWLDQADGVGSDL